MAGRAQGTLENQALGPGGGEGPVHARRPRNLHENSWGPHEKNAVAVLRVRWLCEKVEREVRGYLQR